MRFRGRQIVLCLTLVLLAASAAEPALAQRGRGQGKPRGRPHHGQTVRPPERREPALRPWPGKNAPQGQKLRPEVPPRWMERLQRMSPEEQERFLNNNERFRGLPPGRQAEVRRNLERWNRLTPDEQEALRQRHRVLERMTPEQRSRFREEIWPRWQQLGPERRHAIGQRLGVLHNLSESERAARLQDQDFLKGLSLEEQQLLRDLAELRLGLPPDRTEPPPEHPPTE